LFENDFDLEKLVIKNRFVPNRAVNAKYWGTSRSNRDWGYFEPSIEKRVTAEVPFSVNTRRGVFEGSVSKSSPLTSL
jgi:hypothetical protein